MEPLLASVRSMGGLDRVGHVVQWLEDEWRKHGDVPLERLWDDQRPQFQSNTVESLVLLAELVKTDLRCRFARGQTPTVAGYLERFPELEAADSRVLSLIYEEFCLAEERGDRVDVDAFCDRYPRWKDSLVSQLQYHHLLSQAAGVRPKAPPFPEAGDSFEEFELISLLGRGGTSRVFLARDLSLGGKQVVLKVSLDRGREPQAQGALDHPHIVPVNSVVFGDGGMRGLSMPYRPGLPLDEVIRRVEPASKPRHAMALWEALVRPSPAAGSSTKPEAAPPPSLRPPIPKGDGWEGFPVRGTYAQGVAWIVKVIAEALHYAHQQRTFHRDVKPANVLLAVQFGPQLLDFNLAESPHSASQAQAAMHGGTLPYMAPEQIEAFLNPDLWGKVGAQADIYSLGLVLRELLTGQAPDLPAETLAPARAMRVLLDRRPLLDVSVRRSNPAIPHALEAIVARCLSVPVADRYPDAGALAADLDCFLRRRPLAHAVNPSRRERCTNWGIRNWILLAFAAACLGFLLVGIVVDRSMTARRPSVPIESSPDLLSAVASLNQGDPSRSQGLLGRLADQYPDSCLPRVYLGLAYAALGHEIEAEHVFGEVLGLPDARRELLAWSPKDPQLPEQLDAFVERRFLKADLIEARGKAEGERAKTLKDQYRMAEWALEVSRRIRETSDPRRSGTEEDVPAGSEGAPATETLSDPDSGDYALASARHELGDYESVIQTADRMIKSLNEDTSTDRATQLELAQSVQKWRRLRSRALTMLADRLRKEGSSPRLQQALDCITLAEKDLKTCRDFVSNRSRSVRDLHAIEKVRITAAMIRVEIRLDLGDLKSARADLARAKDTLQKYDEISGLAGRTDDLDYWYGRFRLIDSRLRREADGLSAR